MKSHSNHLIHESSPYLLQHAGNPVDWYPWGEAALHRAKLEDKPILVSIGYAACHWCHVMERESFEDEETAKLMNEHFVSIKIDREERPDLDHIYMDAVQAITGSGGWPLNVFLTPDRQPFFGGTYFPPVRAYNRPSWKEILLGVATAFKEKRADIRVQAEDLTAYLAQSGEPGMAALKDPAPAAELFTAGQLSAIYRQIMAQADRSQGGFGNAPKFPATFVIRFLLRYYYATREAAALEQALLSIDKMINGGIYDQLGGGFARYSTDPEWLAPHFEKMLYDNALLVMTLGEAYQLTGKPLYAKTIRHTLAYIEKEMSAPEGGFYAALDADSEGVEGKYYVWSKQEVESILGGEAPVFCAFYDITEQGNWEGKNILRIKQALPAFAGERGITDPDRLEVQLDRAAKKLLACREKRIKPSLDDKILLSWNALMIIAYCKAYAAIGEEKYKKIAEKSRVFLLERFRKEEGSVELWHTYKEGIAKYPAFLDDYATCISALLHLQEINADKSCLLHAKALTDFVLDNFLDKENGFFYYTPRAQEDVIVRKKEVYDGAIPSGNALMAANLHYLSIVFGEKDYGELSLRMTAGLIPAMQQHPASFGAWAMGFYEYATGIKEVAIVGNRYRDYTKELLKTFLPGALLMSSAGNEEQFPLLREREKKGETLIYLCRDYACRRPVNNVPAFLDLLDEQRVK